VTFQLAAGVAAFACSMWSVPTAVRDIRTGKATPSPVAWLIFGLECAAFVTTLRLAGGWAQLGLVAAETISCCLIAVLAWRAARRRHGHAAAAEEAPVWVLVLTVAGVAVACAMVVAGQAGLVPVTPVQATLVLIGVDLTGGVVALRGVARNPGNEPVLSWLRYGMGEVWATVAAIGSGWIFWATSLSGLAVAAAITGMAWRGGERVSFREVVLS